MELTISQLIAEGARTLGAAGIQEPRREAALLVTRALGRDRTFVIAHGEEEAAPETVDH